MRRPHAHVADVRAAVSDSATAATCVVPTCDVEGATSRQLAARLSIPRLTRGMCPSHYHAWRTWGDPLMRLPRGQHRTRKTGADVHNWKGAAASITAMHHRCRSLWGPASGYPCVNCNEMAAHWAYDGTDPNQLYGPTTGGYWCYYSEWPEFYMPMCARCHNRRDKALARAELHEYRQWKHRTGLTLGEAL